MSGHPKLVSHGAFADAVPRPPATAAKGGPAATPAPGAPRTTDPPNHQLAPPTAAARLPPARARWQQSDATKSQ